MSTSPSSDAIAADLTAGAWQLDPDRSSVEFQVRHFYGLMTVVGHFARYEATLNVSDVAALSLIADASSLDTGNARRDKHLRSRDFFDSVEHPEVRFEAAQPVIHGGTLRAHGTLSAGGRQVPLDVDATLSVADAGYAIEATALVDHRLLGMTWSPLGIMRAPSTLIVRGRLVPVGETA